MLSTKTAKLITLLFISILGIGCSQSSDIPTAQPVDLTPVLYQQIPPTQSGNSTQIPPSATETPVATTIPVPSPTDSPAPSAAVTRKTAGPPVKGGTLLLSGDSAPILDPHRISDPASADIVVEIFGGLVTYEIQDPSSWNNPQLRIVGDLAEKWEISGDGRTYTFYLRDNAYFHDGKKVTAHDIKWSLERATDPTIHAFKADFILGDILGAGDKLQGLVTELAGVTTVNGDTLSITTDGQKAYFLAKLTQPTAFVLDENNLLGVENWITEPNGTGPFRLVEYAPGQLLRLERNEDYHLSPPYLDEVQYSLGGGDTLLMYRNDQLHIGPKNPHLETSDPFKQELRNFPPPFQIHYIGMNFREPPFNDLSIRQAFNYSVDQDTIASNLSSMNLPLIPAIGILPPGFPGYSQRPDRYDFDLQTARQMLKDSQYGPDFFAEFPTIRLNAVGCFGECHLGVDDVLISWGDFLKESERQGMEYGQFLNGIEAGEFQLYSGYPWSPEFADPYFFLDVLFHSDGVDNLAGYSNPEVDKILEQARIEMDQEVRMELYRVAEDIILEDSPWIPLWHGKLDYVLVKPQVSNYYFSQMLLPKLRYVYLSPVSDQ